MAQWSRALTALAEDPGLSLSTYMVAHKYLYLQFQGIQPLLLASMGTRRMHTVHRHTCRQNTHTHKMNKPFKEGQILTATTTTYVILLIPVEAPKKASLTPCSAKEAGVQRGTGSAMGHKVSAGEEAGIGTQAQMF